MKICCWLRNNFYDDSYIRCFWVYLLLIKIKLVIIINVFMRFKFNMGIGYVIVFEEIFFCFIMEKKGFF